MRFEQLHVLKALGDLVTELPQKLLEGHMQDMLLSRMTQESAVMH